MPSRSTTSGVHPIPTTDPFSRFDPSERKRLIGAVTSILHACDGDLEVAARILEIPAGAVLWILRMDRSSFADAPT